MRIAGHREKAFQSDINRVHPYWGPLIEAGVFGEIEDPVRRYAMVPGRRADVPDPISGETWTFEVNAKGARGPAAVSPKPARERRILCVGDSFAFGLWCDQEQTLVGHLARMANERERANGSDVQWKGYTIGVPGYHSGQQLRALVQDGLALEPDVVVLYFNSNDIMRDGFFFDEQLGVLYSDFSPFPAQVRRSLWRWSHLYSWIVLRQSAYFNSLPSPHLDPRAPWSHLRADNQEATRAAIAEIAQVCDRAELPLFFLHQPLMTWHQDARGPNWPILPLVKWAEDLRAELGLPGLCLLGWMRGYRDGIDRIGTESASSQAPPPDFIPDLYFSDVAVQSYRRDYEQALREGKPPPPLDENGLPPDPDFHLIGEGYGDMARLTYAAMAEAGMLPR